MNYRGYWKGSNIQAESLRKPRNSPESKGGIPGSLNSKCEFQEMVTEMFKCLNMCQKFWGVGEENECLEVAGFVNAEAGLG